MKEISIPSKALYGLWDHDKSEYIEWYYSDEEAEEADIGCRRSGLNLIVQGVNGTDDTWLDEVQV